LFNCLVGVLQYSSVTLQFLNSSGHLPVLIKDANADTAKHLVKVTVKLVQKVLPRRYEENWLKIEIKSSQNDHFLDFKTGGNTY
jgi:hypothetical protein